MFPFLNESDAQDYLEANHNEALGYYYDSGAVTIVYTVFKLASGYTSILPLDAIAFWYTVLPIITEPTGDEESPFEECEGDCLLSISDVPDPCCSELDNSGVGVGFGFLLCTDGDLCVRQHFRCCPTC